MSAISLAQFFDFVKVYLPQFDRIKRGFYFPLGVVPLWAFGFCRSKEIRKRRGRTDRNVFFAES